MRGVVADTGPLQYLVLIGEIGLLPRLFGSVAIPATVHVELRHPGAPHAVRAWAAGPPPWLTIAPAPAGGEADLPRRGAGERAAIALAAGTRADLLLMDDRAGVAAALARGLGVIGTLGILDRAAQRGLVELDAAFARLQATNFRYPPGLLETLLAGWRRKRGG